MHKESITKRAFRVYSSYNPVYFPLQFLQILFGSGAPYFNLWISAEIVTVLYEGGEKKEIYLLAGAALLGNLLIRMMASFLEMTVKTQFEVLKNNEAAALNHKTLSLDYDKIENPAIRQLRRKISDNQVINGYGVLHMKYCIEMAMTALVNLLFSALFFTEMVVLIVGSSFQWLGMFLFLGLIVCMILDVYFDFQHTGKMAKYNQEIGGMLLEENRLAYGYSPAGMDNRIYRQQKLIRKIQLEIKDRHRKSFSKASHHGFVNGIPGDVCLKLCELCSYLIVCLYCTAGLFPVGSVIKYVGYLSKVTDNAGKLFIAVSQMKINEPYLQVYLEYLDIPNDMYQGSLAVEKRSDKQYDVAFKNVSFRYAGSDRYALKQISLDLKAGVRLAVVGRNGSGKTTFIKLLCRLYDPTEGEIVMNDFNIRKYDYRQYLDLFSVVFQDYHLLSLPLGNNVASAETWDTGKAEWLLKEVGFGERYGEMSKQLETPLYKDFDEDGVEVSGGEAQKIALARALYKDAPFIILDEPTAALDPIAEAEIYASFDRIAGDKTAIYISHRLSSCRFCDRIVVFDEGEIVQIGTHEELLSDVSGKYYELWNAQAQYYREKGREADMEQAVYQT